MLEANQDSLIRPQGKYKGKAVISRSLSYFDLSLEEVRKFSLNSCSFQGKISILNLESTCECHNVRVSDWNILLGQN